jgi:flagellar L-ring protein FlgH
MIDELENIGREPELKSISIDKQVPVSMPMPLPQEDDYRPNSLWQSGAKAFFKDQRASNVGDIITVSVNMDDEASLQNTTTGGRSKDTAKAGVNNLFGLEKKLSMKNILDLGSDSIHTGSGSIKRNEKVSMKVAATIVQILPNGNLVIYGRQQIRINYELREIQIGGIIRRSDILPSNMISSEKIAEARISYGGKGYIQSSQKPKWGYQILDSLMPF